MNYMINAGMTLLVIGFGITVPTLTFFGIGYVFSHMFNLPLFNATIICIGATFVFTFFLFLTRSKGRWWEDDYLEFWS